MTIYRDDLALITETRTVDLPAGAVTLVIDDVVETLLPQSAIVTDSGRTLAESNFDFDRLTPRSLLERSIGAERDDHAHESRQRPRHAHGRDDRRRRRRRRAANRRRCRGALLLGPARTARADARARRAAREAAVVGQARGRRGRAAHGQGQLPRARFRLELGLRRALERAQRCDAPRRLGDAR